MAEGGGDLKVLIRLRKQQHTFSRMISWEFSQEHEPKPSRKLKRRKKQETPENTCEDRSEEEIEGTEVSNRDTEESSEYETAPEDDYDIEEVTDSLESCLRTSEFGDLLTSSFRITDSSVFDNMDLDEDISDEISEEEDKCSEEKITSESGGLQPGRRRRLSKRQKRKRSERHKVTYANELYSMAQLFENADDINNVFSEIQENPGNATIQRNIPSLSELCMLATRKKTRSTSEKKKAQPCIDLPPGIKRLFIHWGTSHKMLSEQLSFLQNQILPLICDKDGLLHNRIYHYSNWVRLPVRCVWSALPISVESGEKQYRTGRTAAYLFTPSFHCPEEQGNYSYPDDQYLAEYCVSTVSCLSAFANTIDLMLPGTVFTRRKRHDSGSESDALAEISKTMLSRVKNALKLRYPHLVDNFFNVVLPYVMWARGNISMTTELFRSLCSEEKRCCFLLRDRCRAMFLCEIAHMHQMFGDSHTAESFYRLAGETALEDAPSFDQDVKEVTEQTQVLLAGIHDMGLLTSDKAVQSCKHWNIAVGLPDSLSQTAMAGLLSFLCYHAAHWTESDWIKEGLSRIQRYEKNNKSLLYFNAMLHALQGKERESKLAYMDFKHNTQDDSLSQYEQLGGRTKNPWLPLVNLAAAAKSPVLPMNVVWRTQLQPQSITDECPMEAQVSSIDLNLRISESGHLTGDMQMLLPPMREILLDLYTGQLVINNVPGQTTSWKSACFHSRHFQYTVKGLFVPTPVLIHQWKDGSTVHLVHTQSTSILQRSANRCPLYVTQLYWRGASGQSAKLNVSTEVKNFWKKTTLEAIKLSNHHFKPWSDEKKQFMAYCVEQCYNKNLCMDVGPLSRAVGLVLNGRQSKPQKDRKKKERTKKGKDEKMKWKEQINWPTFTTNFIIEQEPCVIGKTVLLQLQGSEKLAMLIHTGDKESLKKPCIFPMSSSGQFLKNYANTQFVLLFRSNHNQLSILNNHGEQIQVIDVQDPLGSRDMSVESTFTIGAHLFGINQDATSVWKYLIDSGLELGMTVEDNISQALVPYWSELEKSNGLQIICSMCPVGQELGEERTLILLHLSVGIGWMDPNTLEMVHIEESQESSQDDTCKFSEDHKVIAAKFNHIKVLAQKVMETDDSTVCRVGLGCDNEVIIVEITERHVGDTKEHQVMLRTRVSLTGSVKELHFIGKGDFLVTFTHCTDEDIAYIEHLLHFKLNGSLSGVLMCLGRGPRSFTSVYLHGDGDEGQAGWYVYMRDGHNGIIGVRLNK